MTVSDATASHIRGVLRRPGLQCTQNRLPQPRRRNDAWCGRAQTCAQALPSGAQCGAILALRDMLRDLIAGRGIKFTVEPTIE